MKLGLGIRSLASDKTVREYAVVFAVYLLIALVMFWNITINISGAVVNNAGASYQGMWNLWWVPYSAFVLHQSPYFTDYLFYPIGANLAQQALAPAAGILTLPFQAVSLALAYNILFFMGFVLGGLFMYMLARYIVRNRYAAFIAGIIFAFSPVHIAQAYAGLQWTTVEFIPLFVLFFIMTIRERKPRYAAFAGISFFLLTFMGDVQQGALMLFFTVASLLLLAMLEKNVVRKAAVAVAILAAIALVLSLPMIALSGAAQGKNTSLQSSLNDIPHEMLYSDTVASFFLPSYYNGIFNGLSANYYNRTYGLNYSGVQTTSASSQKVAYLGYTAILLAIIGIAYAYGKERRHIIYWSVIFALFAILALGPVFQVTGAGQGIPSGPVYIGTAVSGANVSGIPSLYFLYRYVPVINAAQEPAAFDIVAMMALAVIAAFGFERLIQIKDLSRNTLAVTVVVTLLILLEYNGMPLSISSASALTANATIPKSFYEIGNLTGNFSVLSLPSLPAENGSFYYPKMAMFYETAAKKPLVGGYATVMNSTQQVLLENIPLVVESNYLEGGQGFLYPYPINENYSNLTMLWLAKYNIGFISVANKAYTQQNYALFVNYMESIFGAYITYANTTVFQTSTAVNRYAGGSLVSYIIGTWIPGYLFCGSGQYCNRDFATMWWGRNLRAINLFSPIAGAVTMRTDALSYYGVANIDVLVNGVLTSQLNATNSTAARQTFSLNMNVSKGFNQVVFYEQNSTLQPQNTQYANYPYFTYGMYNISFTYLNGSAT